MDLTGESGRATEFGYMLVRRGRRFRDDFTFDVLANRVGDSGAAFCVLAVILAAFGVGNGYMPGPIVLISSSSRNGNRASTLLQFAEPAIKGD